MIRLISQFVQAIALFAVAHSQSCSTGDTLGKEQEEKRQFEFLLGEWEVVASEGHTTTGESSIQLLLDQCMLETTTDGGTGKSFLPFDPGTKKWIQDWVDSQSNSVHFDGGMEKDGVMHYYAGDFDAQSKPIKRHMQFFNLDQDYLRQLSQQSSDGGKTWQMQYDFLYVRKSKVSEGR
jgi:hypothetical protein